MNVLIFFIGIILGSAITERGFKGRVFIRKPPPPTPSPKSNWPDPPPDPDPDETKSA